MAQRFLYTFPPASLGVDILHHHGIFVKPKTLTLVHDYELDYRCDVDFPSFSTDVIASVPGPNLHDHIVVTYPGSLISPNLWQFHCLPLSFITLTLTLIGYFVECPSVCVNLMFLLWSDWSYGFCRRIHRDGLPSHHITSVGASFQHDLSLVTLTLIILLRWCLAGVSTRKLLFFLPIV